MSGNTRLILKGKVQELKEKRRRLGYQADSLMRDITDKLALYEVTKLADIDTERILALAAELNGIKHETADLNKDIGILEAELG